MAIKKYRLIPAALLAVAALGLSACGEEQIDSDEVTAFFQDSLEANDIKPDSVSCPDDISAEIGSTFECTATLDGEEFPFEGTVGDDVGDEATVSFEEQPQE